MDGKFLPMQIIYGGKTTKSIPKVDLLEIFQKNHIILQKVPANLTYLFQPLNVQGGPNGYAKRYMKDKFTVWYSDKVQRQMDAGKALNRY